MAELLYVSEGIIESERTMFLLVLLLMVVFAPVAHLSPPPWSLTVGCAIVDPSLDRSGLLFLCCLSIMSLQCAWGSLAAPIFSPNLLELVLETDQTLTKFHPPAESRPGCGRESVSEPLARAECQKSTSAPVRPKGCCCLKSKVQSLS